jgi:hypothetical protein
MRSGTQRDEPSARVCRPTCVVLLVVLSAPACTSLQYVGATGEPRLLGIGSVERVPSASGRVYRVRAPGLSLRLGLPSTGMTLGLGEVLYFVPACDGCQPVAYEIAVYGLDVRGDGFSLGYDREFGVPLPEDDSVVQFLDYDATRPEATRVWKEEAR